MELSWETESDLHLRCGEHLCILDKSFKPEVPINSLVLETCDKFLN